MTSILAAILDSKMAENYTFFHRLQRLGLQLRMFQVIIGIETKFKMF